MKQRNIVAVIVLGLVTFGIYHLVWLYKTRNEMVAKGVSLPSFWLLFTPLAGFLLLLLSSIVLRAATMDGGGGDGMFQLASAVLLVVAILSLFAFIPIILYWIYRYSQGVEIITKGQATTSFTFWMYVLLLVFNVTFIWPCIIQDYFNKVEGSEPDKNSSTIPKSRSHTKLTL